MSGRRQQRQWLRVASQASAWPAARSAAATAVTPRPPPTLDARGRGRGALGTRRWRSDRLERLRAFGRMLGSVSWHGAVRERLFDARCSQRRGAHVDERDARRAVAHRDRADDGPVLGPAVELLVREARAPVFGTRISVSSSSGPARSRGTPGRSRAPRSSAHRSGRGPRRRRARATRPAGRTPDRRGRPNRRSCRGGAPGCRRPGRRPRAARRSAGEQIARLEVAVAGERADREVVAPLSHMHARHPTGVDEHRRRCEPQLHEREQRHAAGEQLGVVAVLTSARRRPRRQIPHAQSRTPRGITVPGGDTRRQ